MEINSSWLAQMSEQLFQKLFELGPNLLAAIVILVGGYVAVKLVTAVVRRALEKSRVDTTLARFVASLVNMLLLALVIVAALAKLGIDTTSFAAIVAAAGLAIGFALKDSLGNFASGVMLIGLRPFKAGDYVEAGGVSGSVQEVSIFSTVLKTPDNKMVIVPNGSITASSITNFSAFDTRRLDLVIGIGYDDDIAKAKRILEEILAADERVLEEPKPVIAVLELGDSSVNLAVRPWAQTSDYWPLHFDLLETIKTTFDAEEISIPYPQRDVHLHQVA